MNNKKSKVILGLSLLLIVAVSRILPHPDNFTPVIAICLFSAAVFENRILKFVFPFVVILFSDFLIHQQTGFGFHSGTILIYTTFAIILFAAYKLLKKVSFTNVALTTLGSSLLFFLITNFALFYPASPVNNPALGQYTHDFTGIIASYTAGVPFFKNMLVGDLLYTGVLFGAYFGITKLAKIEMA